MRSFGGGVLMGGIGGGGFDTVTSTFEKVADSFTSTKFSAEIEADVFVTDRVREAVTLEPASKEFDGRSFRAEGFPVEFTGVMISDETVAELAIETLISG
jgi:hypothetical protein